jgi:hypothetical protein
MSKILRFWVEAENQGTKNPSQAAPEPSESPRFFGNSKKRVTPCGTSTPRVNYLESYPWNAFEAGRRKSTNVAIIVGFPDILAISEVLI